jgi:hypothetical protein
MMENMVLDGKEQMAAMKGKHGSSDVSRQYFSTNT